MVFLDPLQIPVMFPVLWASQNRNPTDLFPNTWQSIVQFLYSSSCSEKKVLLQQACQHVGSYLAPESFRARQTFIYLAFPVPYTDAVQKQVLSVQIDRESVLWLFWDLIKGFIFTADGTGPCMLLKSYCFPVCYQACPVLLYALVMPYLSRRDKLYFTTP